MTGSFHHVEPAFCTPCDASQVNCYVQRLYLGGGEIVNKSNKSSNCWLTFNLGNLWLFSCWLPCPLFTHTEYFQSLVEIYIRPSTNMCILQETGHLDYVWLPGKPLFPGYQYRRSVKSLHRDNCWLLPAPTQLLHKLWMSLVICPLPPSYSFYNTCRKQMPRVSGLRSSFSGHLCLVNVTRRWTWAFLGDQ